MALLALSWCSQDRRRLDAETNSVLVCRHVMGLERSKPIIAAIEGPAVAGGMSSHFRPTAHHGRGHLYGVYGKRSPGSRRSVDTSVHNLLH